MRRGPRMLVVAGITACTALVAPVAPFALAAPVPLAAPSGTAAASEPPEPAATVSGTRCDGVAVVVDFTALGGAQVPRETAVDEPVPGALACIEVDDELTALAVFERTGLDVDGTAQWGDAFVCRVAGRPASDEDVVLADGSVVRESCTRTPAQAAYWSVWSGTTRDDGTGDWTYATVGVTTMLLGPGDVLGLSFMVGTTPATPPPISVDVAVAGAAPDGWVVLTDTAGTPGGPGGSNGSGGSDGSGSTGTPSEEGAGDRPGSTGTAPGVVPLLAVVLVVGLGAVAVVRGVRR